MALGLQEQAALVVVGFHRHKHTQPGVVTDRDDFFLVLYDAFVPTDSCLAPNPISSFCPHHTALSVHLAPPGERRGPDCWPAGRQAGDQPLPEHTASRGRLAVSPAGGAPD